jgi:hypothetical protein
MRRTRTRSNKPAATEKAKNYNALSCPYNQGLFSIAELALANNHKMIYHILIPEANTYHAKTSKPK